MTYQVRKIKADTSLCLFVDEYYMKVYCASILIKENQTQTKQKQSLQIIRNDVISVHEIKTTTTTAITKTNKQKNIKDPKIV